MKLIQEVRLKMKGKSDQTQFARLLGISQCKVSRLERGVGKLDGKTMLALHTKCKVSKDRIFKALANGEWLPVWYRIILGF